MASAESTKDMKRACPLCGGDGVGNVGRILHPEPARVAGVEIDLGGAEFHLRECGGCGFMFKDPPIPEDRLIDCYRRSSGTHWGTEVDPHRRRFDLIAGLVEQSES